MGADSDLVRSIESALGVSLGGSVTDSVIVIAATSIAVLIGLLVIVWRRSSDRSKEVKPVVALKLPISSKEEDEDLVDSDKTRVTILFGTQTGTAEGFAKVRITFDDIQFGRFLRSDSNSLSPSTSRNCRKQLNILRHATLPWRGLLQLVNWLGELLVYFIWLVK